MDNTYHKEKSYYKLREMLRAHLMRLFSTEPRVIVLLVDPDIVGDVLKDMDVMFKMLHRFTNKYEKLGNRIPQVHVLQTVTYF